MWKILEEFVKRGQIINVGVSDIETETFIQLYDAAEVGELNNDKQLGICLKYNFKFISIDQVKPSINQINLSACCVVPKDLQDFCKERDIRILTHNDSTGWLLITFIICYRYHFL